MKNKKLLIIGISVLVLVLGVIGITYAFLSYSKIGTTQQLVVGDIYMHFLETNEITIENALPSSTAPTTYFEFTVDGKNTSSNDIYYDVNISRGANHPTRDERIRDDLLKFTLLEKKPGESEFTAVVENASYSDLTSANRIWVDTIEGGTNSEISHIYRLYMWIGEDVLISDTDLDADYDTSTWNNDVYATIKVTVTGDFEDKKLPGLLANEIKDKASTTTYVKNYTTDYINNSSYIYNGTRFNTQDKYLDSYTKQDVYYYTGADAKTNGNVLFAGYCWQIVRTTDTGGIKLLYNGVATNNQCNNITKKTGINGGSGQTSGDTRPADRDGRARHPKPPHLRILRAGTQGGLPRHSPGAVREDGTQVHHRRVYPHTHV